MDINIIYGYAGKLFKSENPLSLDFQILDARSADRFYSRVDEPRSGVRRGNIKGSINIPFYECLDSKTG